MQFYLRTKAQLFALMLIGTLLILSTNILQKTSSEKRIVYVITPTYFRYTQEPELIRLCNTFRSVPFIHWIVVEDAENKYQLVRDLLHECPLSSTHLFAPSPKQRHNIKGSNQRNAAIDWLRQKRNKENEDAVVYFADDDNTYNPQIFYEMRDTKRGSTWPVGLVGGSLREGCTTDGNDPSKISNFSVKYKPKRLFPFDMAGFAVNYKLFLEYPDAKFDYQHTEIQEGFLLAQLGFKDGYDLEPKAAGCSRIYVWHTRTERPNI